MSIARAAVAAAVSLLVIAPAASAQVKPLADGARVERNVVYGMYSGLALLLDVHRPAAPNGYGVIFVSGSGWQAPMEYGAKPLKENQIPVWGPPSSRPVTPCSR